MTIDRRITNGLAWAGVLLVIGVPTADLLSAQFAGGFASSVPAQVAVIEPIAPMPAPLSQRPAAPVVKPVEVAAVALAKPVAAPVAKPSTPAGQTATVVDTFLQSGRPLPSYITGAPAPVAAPSQAAAAAAPATAPTRPYIVTTPSAVDPVEVASIAPQKVAPIPMPLSMRPRPTTVATVPAIVIPPTLTPAAPANVVRPQVDVTAADLEDWETGPLSDFLARRQGGNAYVESDANGFFLDQQPRRRDRIVAREADEPFFIFD